MITYRQMNEALQARFANTPPNIARHSRRIVLRGEIGLILTYPGYKTERAKAKIDYSVKLKGHPVSHADIVRDIWGKLESGVNPDLLQNFLLDIAENGIISNATGYSSINSGDGYSLDELRYTIAWIALQEDINYPMPRYQGRRMPFSRYIEAIYAHTYPHNPQQLTKAEVLARTNVRGKPPAPINGIDYGVIPYLQ